MSERYVTPCALPTDYERELLTILMEEAGEVIQRAAKLLRFGRDEVQPGQELSNSRRLAHEIGDLHVMCSLIEDAGLIKWMDISDGCDRKKAQLAKYMQTTRAKHGDDKP